MSAGTAAAVIAAAGGDGNDERLRLDKTRLESGPYITLRVLRKGGYALWSEDAGLPHTG